MREESVCLAVVLAIFWVAPRSCTSFSLSSSKFAEAAAPAARLRSGRMQSCGALSVGAGANNVEEGFAWDPQEAQRLRSLLDGEKQFYEFAKGIKIGVTRTASEGINKLHRGQVEGAGVNLDLARKCLTSFQEALATSTHGDRGLGIVDRGQTVLRQSMEDLVSLAIFRHYLESDSILSIERCKQAAIPCDMVLRDTDYLIGICKFIHELARHGVRQACLLDFEAVAKARDTVNFLQEMLIGFNFRNGPLRRRFDSVKYKTQLLNELMYQGKLLFDDKLSEEELRPDPALIAMFERMRREMDEADEARQRFIRQMRDIERVSKHSIFALQRRDVQKGSHMIGTAAALVANMRMELLNSADPLMGSRAFEEYGEAVFFLEWIRTGRLASLDCSLLRDCSVGEITGAIMDVTGEVNRMAVALATNRDIEGVKACLAIVESIYFETQTMESKFIDGKWPVLRSTLTKMENLVLDLKLSQASGGMHSFVADSAPAYPNGSQFKGREAAEDEDDD